MCQTAKLDLSLHMDGAGWATARVFEGQEAFDVSYLHDTVDDIAQSIIELGNNRPFEVLFVDEPGERTLVIYPDSDNLGLELLYSEIWTSEGAPIRGVVEWTGRVNASEYISQATRVLDELFELGLERYLELWVNFDFPVEKYNIIKSRDT